MREKLTEFEGKEERGSFILMERIQPHVIQNYKVRGNQPSELAEMVSELGIYGIFVSKDGKEVLNTTAGHPLRTKDMKTNEGGPSVGAAVMDSPFLVCDEEIV